VSGPDRSDRPNILFICTDQHRFDLLGAAGNPHVKTPHLDRLAGEGALFEQCYTPNPVCAPTRASILTGRYPRAHGLWGNGVPLPGHERLFTRDLADAGYDCGLVGKLHLGACFGQRTEPRYDDGFRVYRWAHAPSHRSPENAYHRWLQERHPALYERAAQAAAGRRPGTSGTTVSGPSFDDMPAEAHYTRWVGEETVAFLRGSGDPQRPGPFFLWANFFDPHHPFVAPQEYLDRYDAAGLPLPLGSERDLDDRPPILAEASRRSYGGHARGYAEHSPEELRQIVRAYYAMVSFVDDEVGRILAALDELGLRERTLVVFSSDHGEMLGDHGLLLKGPMMYEGAVRVPLLMRWPGVLAGGTRRAELVSLVDLCATFLDAAGLPDLPASQGDSLLPLARGESGGRGYALCEYRNSGHPYDPPVHVTMLRRGRHKLVVHHGHPATGRARTGELYDLQADPHEGRNLWDEAGALGLRTELQELLLDALVASEDRAQPREAPW
jgi:arylsulfatase A-like enzyme